MWFALQENFLCKRLDMGLTLKTIRQSGTNHDL